MLEQDDLAAAAAAAAGVGVPQPTPLRTRPAGGSDTGPLPDTPTMAAAQMLKDLPFADS
jgi:hypothetical protein